jgi:hypothetical protein
MGRTVVLPFREATHSDSVPRKPQAFALSTGGAIGVYINEIFRLGGRIAANVRSMVGSSRYSQPF